jgi:hypothetical protein
MVPFSCFARRAVGALIVLSVPFAAVAAPSPESAASPPQSPTADSRIASKCKETTGDERAACERDIRADAKKHRNGSKAPTPAASATQ